MMEALLSTHNIIVDLPEEMLLVNCDASLIERVLINLLENAHKYAGASATITLRARAKEHWLEIDVTDNGPGIINGAEKTIFDKFSRGNKESAIPGVGLGLAICRAIIEVHEGQIWAENVVQGGARFCFLLPLENPPDIEKEDEDL